MAVLCFCGQLKLAGTPAWSLNPISQISEADVLLDFPPLTGTLDRWIISYRTQGADGSYDNQPWQIQTVLRGQPVPRLSFGSSSGLQVGVQLSDGAIVSSPSPILTVRKPFPSKLRQNVIAVFCLILPSTILHLICCTPERRDVTCIFSSCCQNVQ